jgi:apolipoprotein N-acyltransferase
MGGVANILGFYWLNTTIRVFGGFSPALSVIVFFFFAAYAALPVAIVAFLVRLSGPGPLNLFPPVFWVAVEFLYPHLFPWYLANSQAGFLTLIQSADLVGPYGTSFLLMWFNATLYGALFSRDGSSAARLRGSMAAVSSALILVLLYGALRLRAVETDMSGARTLALAAIQGGVDIRTKWNLAYLESNLKAHRDLTEKVRTADLVVWPESAIEVLLPEEMSELPRELLPSLPPDSVFLFGVRSFSGNPKSSDFRVFNSAFLADARGRVLGRYHKQVLLAFGEYIPFQSVLSKLPGMPPLGDGFTPGDGPQALELRGGIKIASLICYEDLMPWMARRFVAEKGANLLLNLTNDAWFGDTVAPWQHARLAQWRAVETRRALVRATNTGVTTAINPKGEMVKSLPVFTPGVLTGKVEIMEGETFYVRFGDWFAWMNVLAAVGILLRRYGSSRRRH